MSFDVSPLAGSPYTATSVDRTRRAERARRRRSPSAVGVDRHAADPRRGLGSGRRRRASGRQAERRGPRGPLRRPQARRRRGRLARGRRGRHAAPAAARGRRRRRPSLARSGQGAVDGRHSDRRHRLRDGHGVDHHAADVDRVGAAHPHRAPTGDRPGAPGRAAPDRHQAHQSEARRRRPALGRHLDAHAGGLQRQRERPHGAPAHRRRPRRLHGQRLLAGQR